MSMPGSIYRRKGKPQAWGTLGAGRVDRLLGCLGLARLTISVTHPAIRSVIVNTLWSVCNLFPLLSLALSWRSGGVLDLELMVNATGTVGRSKSLRHDTFAAKRAGMLEYDRGVAVAVLVEGDAFGGTAQQFRQSPLTFLDRQPPQILAVEFEQIEGTEGHGMVVSPAADQLEHRSPVSSQAMASPSITHERARSAATAAVTSLNRPERSNPLRVINRTLAASLPAMTRKPSCLISCSQLGLAGGCLAERGRQGAKEFLDCSARTRRRSSRITDIRG